MTVKELKKIIDKLPDEAVVCAFDYDCEKEAHTFEFDTGYGTVNCGFVQIESIALTPTEVNYLDAKGETQKGLAFAFQF